jgi:glycosyltransferase involved in cell wall biosynthesis
VTRRLELQMPRIVHVEVGGSAGGSVLRLCAYLKHCEAGRFQHEVFFYQRPPSLESILDVRQPITELGFSVPSESRPDDKGLRTSARTFLAAWPRLFAFITGVRRSWQLVVSLPRALRLAAHFRRGAYDLIHCNNSFTYQVPTVLGAWIARKPLVSHFRTIRPLTLFDRWLSRLPRTIVAIDEEVADNLKRQGVGTPIVICHNPREKPSASAENAAALRRGLLEQGTALVGTVSRLEEGKGIEDLLAAAHLLRDTWPCVRYVIVGDGSKAEELRKLATEYGLAERVHFAGYRTNVFDYYACMDIFVCPARIPGLSGVTVEAMLMGRPTITTRAGWASELVRDGDTALIVNPGDRHMLAEAIGSLLGDPGLRQAMSTRAAVRVQALCNPIGHVKELEEVFTRALLGTTDRQNKG